MRRVVVWMWWVLIPLIPRLQDRWEPRMIVDVVVLGLLIVWVRGKWLRRLLVGLWTLLFAFECAMAMGRTATGYDPVLYDGIQLVRHLGVLVTDLYGPGVVFGAAAGALGLVGVVGLVSWLAAWMLEGIERRWAYTASLLLVPAFVPWEMPVSAAWIAARQSWASVQIVDRIERMKTVEQTAPHRRLPRFERQPNVRVYIVESYGMTTFRSDWAELWPGRLKSLQSQLERNGWTTAALRSNAPTNGGRSWICDANFLLGRPLRFHAEYQALTPIAGSLDHMPMWFDQQGYRTVLSRQTDRARPGTPIINRFDFQNTYFFEDFRYTGPSVGWGRIPDQYALGFLHANDFNKADGPQFSFVHLATSHMPWSHSVGRKKNWRRFNRSTGKRRKNSKSTQRELWTVARHFTRKVRLRSDVTGNSGKHYVNALDHSLSSIVEELQGVPKARPTIAIILGDHQPAFLSQPSNMDVPVHIAATDPELLEEWLEGGAVPGWMPGEGVIEHPSFYSRMVRMIARYNDHPLPPLLENGQSL